MVVALSSSPQRMWHQQNEREPLDLLRRTRPFSLLSATVLQELLTASSLRRMPRGSFIYLQGGPIASVYLLIGGRVKVVRETEEGRVVIMRLIEPGELFGVVGDADGQTYRNSILTQTNVTFLAIPRPTFMSLLGDHAGFAAALLDEMGKRLDGAEARIQDLQTEHAACRTARVLLRLFAVAKGGHTEARPTLPLSRQDLADLSGTNLSTASRTVSEWEHHGIVESGRERVKLLRPRALAAIAAGRVPSPSN